MQRVGEVASLAQHHPQVEVGHREPAGHVDLLVDRQRPAREADPGLEVAVLEVQLPHVAQPDRLTPDVALPLEEDQRAAAHVEGLGQPPEPPQRDGAGVQCSRFGLAAAGGTGQVGGTLGAAQGKVVLAASRVRHGEVLQQPHPCVGRLLRHAIQGEGQGVGPPGVVDPSDEQGNQPQCQQRDQLGALVVVTRLVEEPEQLLGLLVDHGQAVARRALRVHTGGDGVVVEPLWGGPHEAAAAPRESDVVRERRTPTYVLLGSAELSACSAVGQVVNQVVHPEPAGRRLLQQAHLGETLDGPLGPVGRPGTGVRDAAQAHLGRGHDAHGQPQLRGVLVGRVGAAPQLVDRVAERSRHGEALTVQLGESSVAISKPLCHVGHGPLRPRLHPSGHDAQGEWKPGAAGDHCSARGFVG